MLTIVATLTACGQGGGTDAGSATSEATGTAASGTGESAMPSEGGSEDASGESGAAVPEIACSEGGARTWCFEVVPTDRRPTFMPDFDGDGLADMVGWSYDNIYVAFNDGLAAFHDEWIYENVPGDPFAPMHLMGDPLSGWRLLTGPRGEGDFEVRELPPGGGGSLVQSMPSQLVSTSVAVSGDLAGDGHADGVFGFTNKRSIEVFPDVGNGQFEPGVVIELPDDIADNMIVPGDLDGDGHADIVADFGIGLMAYFGDGAYGFPDEAVGPTLDNTYSIVAADFEGDGRAEVFTLEQPRAAVRRAEEHTWLPPAFESFVPAAAPYGNWRGVVADLDGDGIQEGIAFVEGLAADGERRIRRLHIFSGYADGAFTDQAYVDLNDACPSSVAIRVRFFAPGDLDGDGVPDLHLQFAYECSPDAEEPELYWASLLQREP